MSRRQPQPRVQLSAWSSTAPGFRRPARLSMYSTADNLPTTCGAIDGGVVRGREKTRNAARCKVGVIDWGAGFFVLLWRSCRTRARYALFLFSSDASPALQAIPDDSCCPRDLKRRSATLAWQTCKMLIMASARLPLTKSRTMRAARTDMSDRSAEFSRPARAIGATSSRICRRAAALE